MEDKMYLGNGVIIHDEDVYPVGEVVEQEGYFVKYTCYEAQQALKTAQIVEAKVIEIGEKAGLDFLNQHIGVQTVLLDETTGNYTLVQIDSRGPSFDNPQQWIRYVNFKLSDFSFITVPLKYELIEDTSGGFVLIPPSNLEFFTDSIGIHCSQGIQRVYGDEKKDVQEAPDIFEATERFLTSVVGNIMDPVEIAAGGGFYELVKRKNRSEHA